VEVEYFELEVDDEMRALAARIGAAVTRKLASIVRLGDDGRVNLRALADEIDGGGPIGLISVVPTQVRTNGDPMADLIAMRDRIRDHPAGGTE
jgi:hypothetical protein